MPSRLRVLVLLVRILTEPGLRLRLCRLLVPDGGASGLPPGHDDLEDLVGQLERWQHARALTEYDLGAAFLLLHYVVNHRQRERSRENARAKRAIRELHDPTPLPLVDLP